MFNTYFIYRPSLLLTNQIIMKQTIYSIATTVVSLSFVLTFTSLRAQAQVQNQASQHAPGGVTGYLRWGFGNDATPVSLNCGKGMTFVGVGKVRQGSEQLLWNVGTQDGKTRLVQTTARTADLTRGTFMNYTGRDTLPPLRLYAYVTSSANGIRGTLAVGGKTKERLPVGILKEGMAEYAVYPRALSVTERMRVESAMALRHGVTLGHSYFNSKGTVIRNYYRLKGYNHHVAGIIGDSTSSLRQTMGESSEGEAIIRLSTRTIDEGVSYIWGDDAKRLSFAADKGKGKWMQRRWAATATGASVTGITLKFDTRSIRQMEPLAEGESYYLAVDRSGTGKFPAGQVRYYKAQMGQGDSLTFAGINTDVGESIFTLRAAGDFFSTINMERPQCSTGAKGALRVQLTGGTPPYRITATLDGKSAYTQTTADSVITIPSLTQGKYALTIRDNSGKCLTNEITVCNADLPDVPELEDVRFAQGAERDYQLETKGNYACRWKSPAGRYLNGQRVTLDEDGEYTVELTDGDGCSTLRTLNVTTTTSDGFARYEVSPNPTRDGNVNVRVELTEDAPLILRLHAPDGALLQMEEHDADNYHTTRLYLPVAGTYVLEMRSREARRSVKIIRR